MGPPLLLPPPSTCPPLSTFPQSFSPVHLTPRFLPLPPNPTSPFPNLIPKLPLPPQKLSSTSAHPTSSRTPTRRQSKPQHQHSNKALSSELHFRLQFYTFSMMASTPFTLNCSLVSPIRASSGSSRKPDPNRSKPPSSAWWAPIFGWSSEPDYINARASFKSSDQKPEALAAESAADRPRSRFALGGFTEEKAKQLRKKTAESSSFHDIMYHSAIASRLASDMPEK